MAREVKTMVEVFLSKYPLETIINNDYLLFEAIGWLRGVSYLAPSWSSDAQQIISCLIDIETFSTKSKIEHLQMLLGVNYDEKE